MAPDSGVRAPKDGVSSEPGAQAGNGPAGRRSGLRMAPFLRWLHLYGSMLGLVGLLFFSVTGITLNHPDWTWGGVRRQSQAEGTLDPGWVGEGLPEERVARLEVVERLRRDHGIRGAVDALRVDEREMMVAFKGPGYAADAFIDRSDGRYRLTEVREGWVAVMNDLHKGRHTGAVWAWVIDLSAGVMALISISGLALLLAVRRRRGSGLVAGVVGGVILLALWAWWVP